MHIVNIGLISGAAYAFYTKPQLRRDTRAILSAVAGALTLLTAEGYGAEKYRETPRGQREAEKAKKEGKSLYVAFVDLENAFPSVDRATLWVKLHEWGV